MYRGILLVVVLVAAYAPMLRHFFQQLWSTPHTSFLVFVPPFVAWLFYSRWRWNAPLESNQKNAGLSIQAMLAAFFLLLSVLVYNPWLSAVSAVLMAAEVLRIAKNFGNARYAWGSWALLWLMIPLPLGLDHQLITSLQMMSSRLSSRLLDTLGIVFDNSGNVLNLVGRELFVDEACSGIVSLMTIIGCSAAFGILQNRSPLHVVLLMMGAAFCAMVMNTIRIVTIVVGLEWFNVDLLSGTPHELLGMILFVVTLSLLLSLDSLLQFRQLRYRNEPATKADGKRTTLANALSWLTTSPPEWTESMPGVHPWKRFESDGRFRKLLWLLVPIALLQIGMSVWINGFKPMHSGDLESAIAIDSTTLPADFHGLRMAQFESPKRPSEDIFGEYSKTYTYVAEDGQAYTISCDFPFGNGWHELSVCYLSSGWRILERRSVEMKSSESTFVNVAISRDDGRHGYVAWTLFDEFGQSFSPPAKQWLDQIWRLVVRRNPHLPSKKLFQVQVLVVGPVPISPQHQEIANDLLEDARGRFMNCILGGSK